MNSKNIGLKRMPKKNKKQKKRTQNKDVKFYLMILPKKKIYLFFLLKKGELIY